MGTKRSTRWFGFVFTIEAPSGTNGLSMELVCIRQA